jgi:hypothetical protein
MLGNILTTADDKHEQEEEIHFTTADDKHEKQEVCHVYKISLRTMEIAI